MAKTVLYINGLGDGTTQDYEAKAFARMEASGFRVVHAHVQWRQEQDLSKLLARLIAQAKSLAKSNDELIIIGLSAGSSMALNVYAELKNSNIRVINIIGRLRKGNVLPWSYRTIKRAAHFGTKHESRSFYDSVMYCESRVLPYLTMADKKNIMMLKPLTDLIVPLHTMSVPGIKNVRIWALGHIMACTVGLSKVADIIKS